LAYDLAFLEKIDVLNGTVPTPLVEFVPEKTLEMKASRREKQQQSGCIRNKAGGKQDNAGYENKQGVYHFFGRRKPLLHALSDPQHGLQALHACQGGTDKSGDNDDGYRIEGAQKAAQFDNQINFGDRDKREC